MNMVPVASTSIEAIGYDPKSQVLRIAFRTGGLYEYHEVPQDIAASLIHAPSKGRFYAQWIKGRFNPLRIL